METVLDRLPGIALAEPAAPSGLVFRKPVAVPARWLPSWPHDGVA